MSFLREPNAEPIPGYRLIEPLGSGGFGEAWKCVAPGGLYKAIKFVYGNLNSLDCDGARAEQERKALDRVKAIRHPFVLQMDRIEVVDGELVIVMELADKSLHDAFEECRSAGLVGIPRDTLLGYIRDAAEALDHMNEQYGLQHLDIKPRNLFLVSNRVKVADFGLVKALERSDASGLLGGVTPLYAPPETFTNQISCHSDQYSLAIVYQELLTGHRPFGGKNARQLANQHMNEKPDLRALPETERPIVARALEKDPARRFPSCLSFVRALYSSRPQSFAAPADRDSKRPKTMVDTLEDLALGGWGEDAVDLAPDLGVSLAEINESGEAVSKIGVTIAAPSTGSLRPTVLLGIGGYGRRALMELRCRFLDRFGDLDKVPLVRFLYIDTDPDAIKVAQKGAAEVAFRPGEVYHLPLQPVSHYRRRQIDQLADWLPREKLYSVPRNLKTQGARALGRLAFTDNYLRLVARLKREVQQACNGDALVQTVQQTGLAIRDNVPRVYIVGGATGGASGLLPDLGYAARRLLAQMQQPDSPVVAFLFCGAPDDPATPRAEQANLYATLTELNHFSDPTVRFSAQYGADGPRLVDEGAAFDQVYLLTQQHRSPEGRRDAVSHVGSYLFHELTTPLGVRLDQGRVQKDPARPFRSLGTFGVWFPRGLLLRLAARDACKRLMDEWQSGGGGLTGPEQALVGAAEARALAGNDPKPEALASRLAELAGEHMDAHPREALTRLLLQVEEQSVQPVAQDDPGAWARQTVHKVRDWLGSGVPVPGVNVIQQRRSQLTRALEAAAAALAAEWDARLGEAVLGLMEHSGRRIAIAEAAVARFIHFCDESSQSHQAVLKKQAAASQQQLEQLDAALQGCITGAGAWSLFGGKSRRLVRVFVDHLAAHARQCLAEDTATAVLQFYAALRGRLSDRLRDLGQARQRLRYLQEALGRQEDGEATDGEGESDTGTFTRAQAPAVRGSGVWRAVAPSASMSQTPMLSTESYWQSIREAQTNRVVLPDAATDLEQAARRFLATLNPEHWGQLDQVVGEQVLSARGGLLKLCLDSSDVVRHFLAPLLNQAISCLSNHLPITDVAQVELVRESAGSFPDRLSGYYSFAFPLLTAAASAPRREAGVGSKSRQLALAGRGGGGEPRTPGGPAPAGPVPPRDQQGYLLIPASDAGKAFGEKARQLLPDVHLVNVPGQADLMFCREQGALGVEDIERVLQPCRNAYYEQCLTVQSSPHARFDINDWAPLDP